MSDEKNPLKKARQVRQGQKLLAARNAARMPAETLVTRLHEKSRGRQNYTSAAVYAWEKGRNAVPEALIPLLAEILECSEYDLLLTEEETQTPSPEDSSSIPQKEVRLIGVTRPARPGVILDYLITIEDIDLLREIIPKVGGAIPARTAIELLEHRKRTVTTAKK